MILRVNAPEVKRFDFVLASLEVPSSYSVNEVCEDGGAWEDDELAASSNWFSRSDGKRKLSSRDIARSIGAGDYSKWSIMMAVVAGSGCWYETLFIISHGIQHNHPNSRPSIVPSINPFRLCIIYNLLPTTDPPSSVMVAPLT